MENQTQITKAIPDGLKKLPIFQVIGDSLATNIPAVVRTPEQGKTVATVAAGGLVIGAGYLFFTNLSTISMGLLGILGIFAEIGAIAIGVILGIVLLTQWNRIVNGLNNVARVKIRKTEKNFVRNNFMDQLSVLLDDAKDTLTKVKNKIVTVEASKIKVIQKSQEKLEESKKAFENVIRITDEVNKIEKNIAELSKKGGYDEKVNDMIREQKTARMTATLRKSEGESANDSAKLYAQCGNQISKVVEILKDNECAAKIYVGAIVSSVKIMQEKVEVTNDINLATQNLAEAFQIKDSWMFVEAMDAAQSTIAANIANIRGNLQFVDENRGAIGGTMTTEELNNFSNKLNSGTMKTLNVAQVTSANYTLADDEIVASDMNIL